MACSLALSVDTAARVHRAAMVTGGCSVSFGGHSGLREQDRTHRCAPTQRAHPPIQRLQLLVAPSPRCPYPNERHQRFSYHDHDTAVLSMWTKCFSLPVGLGSSSFKRRCKFDEAPRVAAAGLDIEPRSALWGAITRAYAPGANWTLTRRRRFVEQRGDGMIQV